MPMSRFDTYHNTELTIRWWKVNKKCTFSTNGKFGITLGCKLLIGLCSGQWWHQNKNIHDSDDENTDLIDEYAICHW